MSQTLYNSSHKLNRKEAWERLEYWLKQAKEGARDKDLVCCPIANALSVASILVTHLQTDEQ